MAKLVLTDHEVRLIKGLIAHTDLNSQQILSIFSFLDRNINHREIGAIRDSSKPRYAQSATASKAEIQNLLFQSKKISLEAGKLGLLPLDERTSMVLKSIEIMKSAVLIYNNNNIVTRTESFIVLAVIAWTYALHSYYRDLGVEPVYLDDNGKPKTTADGKPRLWELSNCINHNECPLSDGAKNNLKYIIAIRNEVEHRSCEDINDSVQSKVQATALNFLKFCVDHLGKEFDFSEDLAFTIQLATLKLGAVPKGDSSQAASVSAVNAALEASMSNAEYNDPEYAFRIHVVPKVTNNPNKADQAVSYSPIDSPVEVAIKQVERPKFLASQAIEVLKKKGFDDLNMHRFTQAWKSENLKNPGKGLAVQLGQSWFWYQEGIDQIAEILSTLEED